MLSFLIIQETKLNDLYELKEEKMIITITVPVLFILSKYNAVAFSNICRPFAIVSPKSSFQIYRERSIINHSLHKPLSALLPWESEEELDSTAVLADKISHDPDKLGKLARLAVAFSPPGQKLNLKDLEHVEVLMVDNQHIEIAAVMCDDEQCVSVLIPVSFPHSCDDSGFEECVFHEIDELDEVAEIKISKMQDEEQEETTEDLLMLSMDSSCTYPNWWVKPTGTSDLQDECELVMNLLNEDDFRDDINALAMKELSESLGEYYYEYNVLKTVVAEVGLSGIFLRASATKDNDGDVMILEIPISFGGDPVNDASSLRAAVLGTVAAVHVD